MSKFFPPWRNQNAGRRYPFCDTATLVASEGDVMLSDATFVDAAISVKDAKLPVRIGRLLIVGQTATLYLVDADGIELGIGSTEMGTNSDVVALRSVDGTWIGTLVFGVDSNYSLFAYGDGEFVFDAGATDFVISTVLNMPGNRGLLALSNSFGDIGGFGDIHLVGEYGVQLETSQQQELQMDGSIVDVTLIRVHAMGDPQFQQRNCSEQNRRTTRPITELVFQYGTSTHSCSPDDGGNVIIVAATAAVSESALQTIPQQGGLMINLPGKRI
jgi:hypothetical protein